MQIKLNWHEPIELGSSQKLRETFRNFDFSSIPEVAGIYIFYRKKKSGAQEALYVGQSKNIRSRFKQHSNNLALIEGLEETPQGAKMFMFAEVVIKNKEKMAYALNQAERGYIQYFLDENHPLLNQKLLADHFDQIISVGENIIDLVEEEIDVYTR